MRAHSKALTAVLTTLCMIAILFIPLHTNERELSVQTASVKIRLTPPSPERTSILRKEEVPEIPQEAPHEQRAQTSVTEELEEIPDRISLSDTVGELMPRIERPQRTFVERPMPPPEPQTFTDTEEERTAMHYHSLEEVTTAPGFDRVLLASRIVYPDLAKRQGKEGLVMLRLFISSRGEVERVIVEQDPGYGFAEAALRAFQDITGTPAMKDGKAVAVTLLYPVRFTLS